MLVAHLATIAVCFGVAPCTKFVHVAFRFLAIVAANLESARAKPHSKRALPGPVIRPSRGSVTRITIRETTRPAPMVA